MQKNRSFHSPRFWKGLSFRLLLSFLVAGLIPLTVVVYLNVQTSRHALEKDAYRALSAAASHTALRLKDFVANNLTVLATEARLPHLIEYLDADYGGSRRALLHDHIVGVLNSFRQKDAVFVDSYGLLDNNGINIADTDSMQIGRDFSSRTFFRQALETGLPCVSEVEFERDGKGYLYFSSPVHNRDGLIKGVLWARYSAVILQQLVSKDSGLVGEQSFAMLINEHDVLLAYGLYSFMASRHILYRSLTPLSAEQKTALSARYLLPADQDAGSSVSFRLLVAKLRQVSAAKPFFISVLPDDRSVRYAAALGKIDNPAWRVIFFQPTSVFQEPALRQVEQTVYPVVVLVLLLVLAALGWSYWLARPIRDLAVTADRITAGDLTACSSVALEKADEVGWLAHNFQEMTARLRQRIELEALIATISRHLLTLEGFDRSLVLRAVLGRVGTFAAVQRAFIMEYDRDDPQLLVMTGHWDCDDERSGMVKKLGFHVSYHSALVQHLQDTGLFACADIRTSDLSENEVQYWELNGTKALLCAAIYFRKELAGFIALECRNSSYAWQDTDTYLIGMTAEIVGRSLERLRIEEEKSLIEERLRHSAKMEAVGTLAGGIAHDFNNLLQGISGYLQLLLLRKDSDDPDYDYLTKVDQTAGRAAELVRRLLAFSRKVEVKLQPADLNAVIENSLELLQRTIPKMVSIKTDLASDLPTLLADPTQIEQVVVNLVNNAVDAMEGRGLLQIATAVQHLAGEDVELSLSAGSYVVLTITDDGIGMDEATRQRIFEPFFTTKGTGKGTGLGLATAYGIVQQHQGAIRCTSWLDKGTTFTIYLPIPQQQQLSPGPVVAGPERGVGRGTENILLVDDEENILSFVTDYLTDLGYGLETANSAEVALSKLQERPDAYQLLIMDLGMPGMGGETAVQKIRERDSHVPILITSGYSGHKFSIHPEHYGVQGFLDKPYNLKNLAATIRDILG